MSGVARRSRRAVAVALVSVVAACATPPPEPAPPAATGYWQGRFALTMTEPGVEQRTEQAQGRFELRADGARRDIAVSSPFGQTLAKITTRPGRARLETADGDVFEAADADSVIEQALGWRLPVRELPEWLAGAPASDGSAWRVRVLRRFDDGSPRILEAAWPATPRVGTRELDVRIAVDPRPPR